MEKIGEGMTSEVFSDGAYAYKRYRSFYDIKNIAYEVRVQDEIYNKTMLHVAKYEAYNHEIKMTLFQGKTMGNQIMEDKLKNWLSPFIDLQITIYRYSNLDLLDALDTYKTQIEASNLDQTFKDAALAAINLCPKGSTLCHMDYHPQNIIGDAIIDWTNAKLGHPVLDIAMTYIIFRQYINRKANVYLKGILKKTGYDKSDFLKALPVIAFIKLRENIEPKFDQLLKDLILGNDSIYNEKRK